MKAKKLVSQEREELAEQEGSLYREAMAARPRFRNEREALASYTAELEAIAAEERKPVSELVAEVDDAAKWTDRDKRIHELSTLIAALSSGGHGEANSRLE